MSSALTADAQRMYGFLEGWKTCRSEDTSSPLARARRLIDGVRAVPRPRATAAAPAPGVSVVAVRDLLEGLRRPLESARASGEFIDVWAVAGLGRREVPNAAVLAWLLNPKGSHGRGAACLAAFMEQVRLRNPARRLSPEILDQARVEAEHRPLGSDRDRVDIAITAPGLIMFIEVKIDAAEGEAQLSRYAESAQRLAAVHGGAGARALSPLVVFLSPRPPVEVIPGLVHLTWRDVASALIDAAKSFDGPAQYLAHSFARHARSFA